MNAPLMERQLEALAGTDERISLVARDIVGDDACHIVYERLFTAHRQCHSMAEYKEETEAWKRVIDTHLYLLQLFRS